MKKLLSYYSGIAFLAALLWGCNYNINQEKSLLIQDYRNQAAPEINLEEHKSGDVDIYRTIFMDEGYNVTFYSDATGELLTHTAFYGTEEAYDQAKFKWKNDTTVIIGLINSKTDTKISFEVFGKGSSTGMTIE